MIYSGSYQLEKTPCWESVEQEMGWQWEKPKAQSLPAEQRVVNFFLFFFNFLVFPEAGTSIVQARKLILVEMPLLSFLFLRSLSLIPGSSFIMKRVAINPLEFSGNKEENEYSDNSCFCS